MMYKNTIASRALSMLGSSTTIVDLDNENTVEARLIKLHLRTALDTLLEKHEWSFARRMVKLIEHSRDPEPRYGHAYSFPVNAAVIRRIAPDGMFPIGVELYPDQEIPFEVMTFGTTDLIYCNVDNAFAEFTERMSENASFKTYFGLALAAQLAMDIGPALITNNWPKVKKAVLDESRSLIDEGIALDITKTPQKSPAPCPLVRVRWQ